MTKVNLNDLFKPGQKLPAEHLMIEKALEILELSPHGQQLVNLVEKKGITIKIMATPQPAAYLPEKKLAYIGFNKTNPVSPARFVLMLAGILREAQQSAAGIDHPPLHSPLSEHLNVSISKEDDKIWYICTVACELNDQEMFREYNFIEELRKMGYSELLELYIKQERKK